MGAVPSEPSASTSYEEDLRTVSACINGDNRALEALQGRFQKRLMGQLISRGATETEAHDLLADLWAECIVGRQDRPPLFEKYHGKCGLYTWMVTVATHRLVDLKRRQKFQGDLPTPRDAGDDVAPDFDRLPSAAASPQDPGLRELMTAALRKAMAQVDSEAFLLLHLVYLHGVMQREAARMFGWHESKVSRTLDAAMETIATRTIREIKAVDPWLEISWQDFVELCSTTDALLGKPR
jgi:RNA polymerase sigma factor (sigma-70 family)